MMAGDEVPEHLEDRLRRMIISNGPRQVPPPHEQTRERPTANLPPVNGAAPYGYGNGRQQETHHGRLNPMLYPSHGQRSHNASRPPATYGHDRPAALEVTPLDFNRGYMAQQPPRARRQLYEPGQRQYGVRPYQQLRSRYLDDLLRRQLPLVQMSEEERLQKYGFRARLQQICHELCLEQDGRLPQVELECFGSFESGFAIAGSDMDLVIVSHSSEQQAQFLLDDADLPRLLEKRLLQLGYGARLLTRTRVPILKVCELPGSDLLSQLRAEREKWDMRDRDGDHESDQEEIDSTLPTIAQEDVNVLGKDQADTLAEPTTSESIIPDEPLVIAPMEKHVSREAVIDRVESVAIPHGSSADGQPGRKRAQRIWTRDRNAGPLDFPKTGVGVQCDINFFNPLGLHNTQMLRAYSLCDQRVRVMVLFIKAWAKRRKINSAYSGTLSSYGYVLMVLHYLVNVARPPVLPNLQQPWRPLREYSRPGADRVEVDEWLVDFWRRENEILHAAEHGLLTQNTESVGSLLAGFFQYFAAIGENPFFHWTMNVLSLRTLGGILSKEDKGWVKARTEEDDGRKVQYRYLFCIEDPFELDHNVARTVTHNGIVAIRDEFRRAARILFAIGNQVMPQEGHLFDEVPEIINAVVVPKDRAADRKALQHTKPALVSVQTPQQVDLTSKDAFPDLSAPQVKVRDQQRAKSTRVAVGTEGEPTQVDDAGLKATGRKRRRPQRKTVQLNEL